MFDIQGLILSAPAILFGLTIHEFSHGWVAWRLGDPTAKMMGRLTLNPLKHLDPIGTIALFLANREAVGHRQHAEPIDEDELRLDSIPYQSCQTGDKPCGRGPAPGCFQHPFVNECLDHRQHQRFGADESEFVEDPLRRQERG